MHSFYGDDGITDGTEKLVLSLLRDFRDNDTMKTGVQAI